MRFDMVLNQPDVGEISVNLNDTKAIDITDGRLIKMVYRGAPIGSGGFFVENIVDDRAASGDRAGQWKKVSGRGGLAILDDGIIYPVATETSRTFTAVTMGSILLTLITEAKARGCFPTMRTEFSATHDSNGDLWTDATTITLQVGTSLLDVARQFAELGLEFNLIFDWYLGDFALFAYGTALGTDKSASVVVRIGQNAELVSESRESSALKNAYLVSYQAGMTNTSDAASIAAYRRREAYFQASNAPSSGSALVLADAELTAKKDPVHSIQVKLNDGANPPKYGVDYDIGDWIGVDKANGLANEVYRIRGISLDWSTPKFASITLTLNSIKLEQELRTAIAMRKIANGSLGGSTSGVSPDAAMAIDVHDGEPTAHVNRPLSGDLSGTLGAPVVAKLRGVALKNPLNVSDGQVLKYNGTTSEFEAGTLPVHAGSHQSGGGDAVKLDDLAAPDDNTNLDASTSKHGLMKKFPGGTTNFLREDGTFAAPPGGGAGSGDVVGPASAVDGHLAVFDGTTGKLIKDGGAVPGGGGGAGGGWPAVYPCVTPVLSQFAWVNQGSASADEVSNWGIHLYAPAASGDQCRILKKAAPATPYKITALIIPNTISADYCQWGIGWRQASDGKLIFFQWGTNSLNVNKLTSPTSYNSSYGTFNPGSTLHVPRYLRIEDDGTNRKCSISSDGVNFILLHSVGRTDFLTADEVGFYADSNNATWPVHMNLISWKQE